MTEGSARRWTSSKGGKVTGYAGGVERKRALLELEQIHTGQTTAPLFIYH